MRFAIRVGATLALLLGVLTGCSGDDDGDRSAPDPTAQVPEPAPRAKAAPRPAVGRCYRMSYDAAVGGISTARPVSCKKKHTTQTFAVGPLSTVVNGHLLAVDSARVTKQLARECPARFASYVGGSVEDRRLSMLAPIPFSPTLEQSDRGESWFRCDVVALESAGRLTELVGATRKVLDSEAGRSRWARCATGKPGTKGSAHVLCRTNDSWRAVATVDVPGGPGGRWPGSRAAADAGSVCEDRVRDQADDPLSFTWGYEPPTKDQWASGLHYGFCWAPG